MTGLSNPQYDIFYSRKSINLFLAGIGSGKTHLDGLISFAMVEHFPHVRGFIGANTYEQLNSSTLNRVRNVWKTVCKLQEGLHYVVGIKPPKHFNLEYHDFERYDNIISFFNGHVIYKGSLDNYKVHEGKEFAYAILDETKDTREEAVKEVILGRLRQEGIYIDSKNNLTSEPTSEPFNPLYITTSPAKTDWINEWFEFGSFQNEIAGSIYSETDYFKKEYDDKMVTISSTYHNKHNLPNNYIKKIIDNNSLDIANRLIYGNPFVKIGGEFYSSFDRMKHIKPVEFIPDLPIHISLDFNVVPYNTMKCYQIQKIDDIWYERHFDEVCLKSPNNSTERLCQEFSRRHGEKVIRLFYYGDPSGRHRDTRSNVNDWATVNNNLRKYINNYSDRVAYRHPPVIKRRDFANNIFEEKYKVRVMIDPKCKYTIADYEYLKEDPDGKKLKSTSKNKDTGQSYEKYGHCVAECTLITTNKGNVLIQDLRKGDHVLTRKGYKKVIWTGMTGKNRECIEFDFGFTKLTCTPEHKLFVNNEFKEANSLIGTNTFSVLQDAKTDITHVCIDVKKESLNVNKVYDIEVEGQHEYFANGILVHNCSDADDYFRCKVWEQIFDREFN